MIVFPAVLVVAGLFVGVLLLLRASAEPQTRFEANSMEPRISAEVRTGEEQVLIHLGRSLGVATGREEVAYGEIYIAGSTSSLLRLASRSEIGRGFDGEIRARRGRRSTVVEYFVLRIPGDEALHRRIADLDGEIATALRVLDPQAQVRGVVEAAPRAQRRFLMSRV